VIAERPEVIHIRRDEFRPGAGGKAAARFGMRDFLIAELLVPI
jgi:hypothetical protein